LSEFFKTKEINWKKSEDFIVKDEGILAFANDEHVRNTILEGFLPHIQSSIINRDIKAGPEGMVTIKKGHCLLNLSNCQPRLIQQDYNDRSKNFRLNWRTPK